MSLKYEPSSEPLHISMRDRGGCLDGLDVHVRARDRRALHRDPGPVRRETLRTTASQKCEAVPRRARILGS